MARTKPIAVTVEPSVMNWLVDSSGWTREEIAKRLKTSTQNVEKMMVGQKNPSFRQLEELAAIFKRPVASFLLSKPLVEKPKPKDYRLLPEKVNKFDKKTVLVMRHARRLQEICRELSRNVDYETKTKIENAKISDNPDELALRFREKFNLNEEKQRKFKNSYELFNYLRDFLEDQNIYLFQFSMPVEDARGFVFLDESPTVIVINTKDSIEARIFSLMHEVGHILLGESVIDLPDSTQIFNNDIEKWCNNFASAFLLPKNMAESVFDKYKENLTKKENLKYLSNKYKVSKAMLLFKMHKLGYLKKGDYDAILSRFKKEDVKPRKVEEGTRGEIPSEKRCLSEVGNKFVSLVANNYDRDYITYNDALNYLSIKSRNFDKVLSKAKK